MDKLWNRVPKVPEANGEREYKPTKRIRSQEWCEKEDIWAQGVFHEHFDNISQAEGEAILFYLESIADGSGDAELAIDRYWKKYRSD